MMNEADKQIVSAIDQWLDEVVIGLDLCPFAARPRRAGRVRIAVCHASDIGALLTAVYAEMSLLWDKSADSLETSLLVCPALLGDFEDYLDCLMMLENMIETTPWRGEIQVASFHPDYCFADTEADDPANYTNRAPYPIFHLLRERSLDEAIDRYGDTAAIPQRNINTLRSLSAAQLAGLFPDSVKKG